MIGLGLFSVYLSPRVAQAQQEEMQRARDAGYQNGVNDARSNHPMNLKTDNWHGDRLTAYQQGYQEGYRSVVGHHDEGHRYADPEAQRAYEAGLENGEHDRQENRAMNLKTDNWRGDRLEAYRQGYEDGYRGHRDHEER